MTARFRAQTRLCPVLDTQYIQNPSLSRLTTNYLPGYRRNVATSTTCVENPNLPAFDLVRPVRARMMLVVPKTIDATFTIQGPYGSYTYTNTYNYADSITDVWAIVEPIVFDLYGNVPVRYGTLNALTSQATGITYQYGSALPNSGGIFTPTVTLH
uniref:Uncharacterized protein n=1 Tax=viral metagenome TaxID=1070528 RepID=A0A6C0I7H0_9ZZZZ